MGIEQVKDAKIYAPVPDKLVWATAMFEPEATVCLYLGNENVGPTVAIRVVLSGIKDIPDTKKNCFEFQGQFHKSSNGNLSSLGLPAGAKFKASIIFENQTADSTGELTVVEEE